MKSVTLVKIGKKFVGRSLRMASNGSTSLREYCRHQPPGVVFLLCLFSFAVSTCILSLYVGQGASVRNPDYLDWNTLLTQTALLHFCMDNMTMVSQPQPSKEEPTTSKMVNLSITVDVDPIWKKELSGYGKVMAVSQVHLSDMGRDVPHHYKAEDIRIAFVLDPENTNQNTMCLDVQAPASIIEDISGGKSLPENCTIEDGSSLRTVNVTSRSGEEVPHGWCEDGTVFRIGLEGNPRWTVDVSGQDLTLIHLHLMATSVFLFALVGLALLAIFIRGVFHQRRQSRRQQLRNEDDDDELIY